MKQLFTALFFIAVAMQGRTQQLQPAFDPAEYAELLSLAFYSSGIPDSIKRASAADHYHRVYRSPVTGLQNRWTLYLRDDNIAVIDIRGTVNETASWLANFYAAMIPATGSLQLNDSTRFDYQLAEDPKANVHVGWTVALGHIAPDIESKINSYADQKKVKEFLIFGHSQGGAIAFLLRSYLEYEKKKGKIPADIIFKTYCSAAPKPGNLYYAYDFDFITKGGWAYTVVNAADWVPETPFSIQTLSNFNPTNIFVNARKAIRKQKFFVRLAGSMLYSKLEKKPRKAQRKYEKYLGKKIYRMAIRKALPQLKEPAYVHDNNYMRAGAPVILMPDEAYRSLYPENPDKPFTHHLFAPYYHLLQAHYLVK